MVAKSQERCYEVELYRLRGECLLVAPGAPDPRESGTPESCFLKAIELARGQGARLLEWRGMLSLAQLRLRQGRRKDAEKLLRQICSATGETAVIKSARTLLAQLG
jgi:hypothetical protein